VKVRAIDVADLRTVCRVDLGASQKYNGFLDFDGRLWAEIDDCNFAPSTSHEEFLKLMLPEWCAAIEENGWDHVWDSAGAVLQKSTFNDFPEWSSKGLFWDMEEGFCFRALRYAIATVFAWAKRADDVEQFSEQCLTDRSTIHERITNLDWRVRLDRMCVYEDVHFTIDERGKVTDPTRTPNGTYKAISATGATGVNDGLHIVAALADYYFWWSIRLFDWVKGGHSSRPIQDLVVAVYCAKAGLSEIVDLAALLLHEFSHTTGVPATWWECQFLTDNLDCCHFQLGWIFEHRLLAEFGLPLPTMAFCAPQEQFPFDSADAARERFNFGSDEGWSFTFSQLVLDAEGAEVDRMDQCAPSSCLGEHGSLWEIKHHLQVTWSYPVECKAPDSIASGSEEFN